MNFSGLFILDLANNHQGKVEHGLRIIQEMAQITRRHGVRGALKFQFRNLETFIHPQWEKISSNKHIPRFEQTRLDEGQFQRLYDEVKAQKLLAICTPFDEISVDKALRMGFDILKVASCSAQDWPLLEKISSAGKPLIVSTGGLQTKEIDELVSFFEHRGNLFGLMHCVSLYPIPPHEFHLNKIQFLKSRYPNLCIGWSTHEVPDMREPITIAVALGAEMFEKHVGLRAPGIDLNAYSADPVQVEAWIQAYLTANALCGSSNPAITEQEKSSLASLARGIYAKSEIAAGEVIRRSNVYFAMPLAAESLSSGDWQEGLLATNRISQGQPLLCSSVLKPPVNARKMLKHAVHEIKAMLNMAKVALNTEFETEFSHHEGVENFRRTGTTMITCVNREYCKKILVQLPGQAHPSHFHRLKEETFRVLAGDLTLRVGEQVRTLGPGDQCLVMPGVWHDFRSENGCVFEEISTTHHGNDSVYLENAISEQKLEIRKTKVKHWGRFEI